MSTPHENIDDRLRESIKRLDARSDRALSYVWANWEMDGDEQVLVIYRYSIYDDSDSVLWKGEPSEHVQGLVCALIGTIPPRPKPVESLETRLVDWLMDNIGVFDTERWNEADWRETAQALIEDFDMADEGLGK